MAERAQRVKKDRKKLHGFWLGFCIYAGVMVLFLVFVFIYVWNTMKKFEASQPENTIEELVEKLEDGDISSVSVDGASRFEPDIDMSESVKESVVGKELDYKLKTTGADKLTYNIIDENKKVVAEAVLKSNKDKKVLGIITISDWEVDSVKAHSVSGTNKYTITAPVGYKVMVNGVELTEADRKGEPVEVDNAKYIADYVEAPMVVKYRVSGLTKEPVVTCRDSSGKDVNIPAFTDKKTLTIGYESTEMPSELRDYVFKVAYDSSDFFTGRLGGELSGLGTLKQYFPANSYYIDLADKYRVGDMWMYSDLISVEFQNVAVTEYVSYSDVCFSCRVSFDKAMVLNTGDQRIERSDETFYYVNIDGKWLVADIKSNIEE